MRGIKQWLIQRKKRRQERQRVQEIRRQVQALAFQRRLQLLPFHLLLKSQLQSMADSQAAAKPKTIWYRARRSMTSVLRMTTPNGSDRNGLLKKLNPIRLLSLPPVVRAKRRLVIWLLCQGLKLVRLSLGTRKCSSLCSSSSSPPPKLSS